MPKKFNGPNADIDEAVASQKLRGLCIDIMAIRRSIEAKRNNKSGLANSQMDAGLGIYSKLMDEKSMKDFVEDARANGYEAACYNFEAANAGMLKANTLTEKLDEQLEANPEPDALKKIAAQRMVLLQKKAAFQEDKNSDKLANALDKANLDKDVEKLMKDHLFKEVCDKLGTNGLMAQAKGDDSKLVESYALAKQDKLEPYNPVVPAPVKEGPKKVEENKGPQVGQ